MSLLITDLLESVRAVPPLVVARTVAGPRFTAVAGAPTAGAAPATCGVAYTGRGESDPGYDALAETERLQARLVGQPVAQVAETLRDAASDTGAAALNALLAVPLTSGLALLGDENGLDLVATRSAGRRLAVVGAFPYLDTIRVEAQQSWVLELEPEGDQLPASAAPEVIPQADVVGITGSTLANGTLEGLLRLCRPDAFVVLIGPTTPLSPVLFDYGVDVLCGALAQDMAQTLETVAAGGSTRRIPGMRQVSLRRP